MEKTIGELVDELSVTNQRIWAAEDIKRKPGLTPEEALVATKITNVANQKRNNLIEAINQYFGVNSGHGSTKMYGK